MTKFNKRYVDAVERDLDALLANPRATEVVLNEWFMDASLPVPSPELIEFFAMDLLYGSGKIERFITAAAKGAAEAVRYRVLELSALPPASRRISIELATARSKVMALLGLKPDVLHSYMVVSCLFSDSTEYPNVDQGERCLIRLLVESVTLRAIWFCDGPRLDGLGQAVRVSAGTYQFKPKEREVIALQILQWHSYLSDELERPPSKTEMEMFLRSIYPDVSESSATWSDAWKLIGLPTITPRSKRIDRDQIIKLARRAKVQGPKVRRIPRWRVPPNFGAGEELQK